RLDVVPVAMDVLVRRDDLRIRRPEPASAHGLEAQLARQAEAGDGLVDRAGIHPRIDQRRHCHVAGDAAEAVEIPESHAVTPCHQCRNARSWVIVSDAPGVARPMERTPETPTNASLPPEIFFVRSSYSGRRG